MYLEIYIDVLFLVNLGMNLVILELEKKILKWNTTLLRILISSIIGSIAACFFAVYPYIHIAVKIGAMYFLVTGVMVKIAFRIKGAKELCKGIFVLYLLTYCIGGVISSIYYQREQILYYIDMVSNQLSFNVEIQYLAVTAIITAIFLFLTLEFVRKQKAMVKEIYDVDLTIDKACIHTRGLVDTGNCLFDPITGKPVIVIELKLIKECITTNLYEDLRKVIKLENGSYQISNENVTKIRLIPFQSIGKKRGILPAIVLDEIDIYKESQQYNNRRVIAAVYDDTLSQKNEYQIILHKSLM